MSKNTLTEAVDYLQSVGVYSYIIDNSKLNTSSFTYTNAGEEARPIQPDANDLALLHKLVRKRKALTVLGCIDN